MAELTDRVRTVRLLEQAVGYGLASVAAVPAGALRSRTPCAAWDLEHLLLHLRESLTALREAPDLGHVTLLPRPGNGDAPPGRASAQSAADGAPAVLEAAGDARRGTCPAGAGTGEPTAALAGAVREDALALLDSWRRWALLPGAACAAVRVAGMPLPGDTVALVGALELAVHGWDIAQACGHTRTIPVPLALALLRRAPLVADPSTRPVLFAPPLPVSPLAGPGDRLVAYLGRLPGAPA